MTDKIRELAEKMHYMAPFHVNPELEALLRAELKPLLDAAEPCTEGPHRAMDCDNDCKPDNCRFRKLAAELEGWRKDEK